MYKAYVVNFFYCNTFYRSLVLHALTDDPPLGCHHQLRAYVPYAPLRYKSLGAECKLSYLCIEYVEYSKITLNRTWVKVYDVI